MGKLEGMSEQEQATRNPDDLVAEDAPPLDEGGSPEPAISGNGLDEEKLRRREAAMAQIVQYGDPVLKSKASPVTEFDQALREEVGRMIGLMQDGLGVGLAATQVGRLRRFLVFQTNADAEPRGLVNPEIEWRSPEAEVMTEGCLSISGVVVDVERPVFARVRGQDEKGASVLIEASGHEARVLQHEIDHLDGVLILDRTERGQRRGALKALRHGETYSPPSDEDTPGEGVAASAGAASPDDEL